jgi:hypothetical protein
MIGSRFIQPRDPKTVFVVRAVKNALLFGRHYLLEIETPGRAYDQVRVRPEELTNRSQWRAISA